MPSGLTGDRELADLYLPERRTAADVRARLDGNIPQGHRLVDVHDVWLGEPPLPGLVVAADYSVDVAPSDVAETLRCLADTHAAKGDDEAALAARDEAREILVELGREF